MFIKEWPILLVDDEPDVLAVSKLAMKNFEVYGLPLRIFTAASKAEAIELLKEHTRLRHATMAVAFIDVVMETDTAGLELCEYLRGTFDNKVMQLYIRTGQPGVAPERSVIDKYDINGYFTKVEMTEDKLYTLVKSGCRQVLYIGTSMFLSNLLNMLIDAPSHDNMQQVLSFFIHGLQHRLSGEKLDLVDVRLGIMIDGNLIAGDALPSALALDKQPGTSLGGGDKIVRDNQHNILIKVAGTPTTSELAMLVRTSQEVPETIAGMYQRFARSVASLWKQREGVKVG
jgi:CheY-like chemotaxis protein